jgi:hypothetical protein
MPKDRQESRDLFFVNAIPEITGQATADREK